MDFIFVCPEQMRTFKSDDFNIIDNQGVTTDAAGNKILDARIELNRPCPVCGKKHTFHASELSCPFEPRGTRE